jgi:regulator of replication initiation timing
MAKPPQARAHDTMHFKTGALKARITRLERENSQLRAELERCKASRATHKEAQERKVVGRKATARKTAPAPAPALNQTTTPAHAEGPSQAAP